MRGTVDVPRRWSLLEIRVDSTKPTWRPAASCSQALRAGRPAAQLRRFDGQSPLRTDSVRLQYRPRPPELFLERAPFETFDAGTLYRIYYVDRHGRLFGRWSGGGIAIRLMQTPLGTLGEPLEGYFCATPVAR